METNPYAAPTASLDVAPPDATARVGFWPRVGAALIDGVVTWGAGVAIAGLVASLFPDYIAEIVSRQTSKVDPKLPEQVASVTRWMQSMARWSVGATVFGLIYGLAEGLSGRALGKLLLGLRIADAKGKPASWGKLLGRAALKQSSSLLVFLSMVTGSYVFTQVGQAPAFALVISFFFVLRRSRQALHDMATKTAVYRNSDVVAGG